MLELLNTLFEGRKHNISLDDLVPEIVRARNVGQKFHHFSFYKNKFDKVQMSSVNTAMLNDRI